MTASFTPISPVLQRNTSPSAAAGGGHLHPPTGSAQAEHQSQQAQPSPSRPVSPPSPASPDWPSDRLLAEPDYGQPAATLLTRADPSPSFSPPLSFSSTSPTIALAPAAAPQAHDPGGLRPQALTPLTPSPSPPLPPAASPTASASSASSSSAAASTSGQHLLPSPAATAATAASIRLAQARKPSPGLAARLKALGFIATAEKSPPAPSPADPAHLERVGRLPEDQLRQIDQNHQAGSSVLVIERRGRPWKGAGAAVARLPASVVGRAKGRAAQQHDHADDCSPTDASKPPSIADTDGTTGTAAAALRDQFETQAAAAAAAADATAAMQTLPSPASSFLPEIKPSPPLDMDTNKYRLPDHTNGNGTKVQPDIRPQHLEQDPFVSDRALSPECPPVPLPKDTPPLAQDAFQQQEQQEPRTVSAQGLSSPSMTDFNPDASYFNPLGLQRAGSIYTLSRVSFANQLAQLTSLQLPDAESLSSKVSAIPTAQTANRALIGAADQIRNWISKASEVIGGLDSDDDVEWAAAGGREGLEEVENAIIRFEELINVYVGAIEALQGRPDIATVSPDDLQRAVEQMESIMAEWRRMRDALQSVKAQVEIAMEWEELWGMVLGDIQNEMDDLRRLVFEMEERRHQSMAAAAGGSASDGVTSGSGGATLGVDLGDLETIVEETQQQQQQQPPNSAPTRAAAANNRFSIPIFPASPLSPEAESQPSAATSAVASISQDDSSLLALFARMQPLRASLDFLPMRLSVFETRASSCFPTACDELEMRRAGLDASYKKLEKDAESLRKELGEDRWVAVFRGAARQAQKMYESVERSVTKLRESIDAGLHLTNQPLMSKKMESYETKKTHYGPAVERVLAIIDKGVKDRLTLNGEILRMHAELQAQWDALRERMHELDAALEELHADEHRNQQLRDSISSMLSNDRSTVGSAHDTPQSSPPSSVIMSSLGVDTGGGGGGGGGSGGGGLSSSKKRLSAANADNKTTPTGNRRRSVLGGSNSHLPQPATRRAATTSIAQLAAQARRPFPRFASSVGPGSVAGSVVSSPSRDGSVTPQGRRTSSASVSNRPRWNSSTTGVDTGHNFKPLTLTTPSPYAKTPPVVRRSSSATRTPGSAPPATTTKLPIRSPLGRAASSSPSGLAASTTTTGTGSPSRDPPGFRDAPPYRPPQRPSRLLHAASSPTATAAMANRRASFQPPRRQLQQSAGASESAAAGMAARPASSMGTSRRSSLVAGVRPRRDASVAGRESPQSMAGGRPRAAEKPKWRY